MVEVPRAYRRGRRRRAITPWLWPAAGALFAYLYTAPLLERWHIPPPLSQMLGFAIVAALMTPFGVVAEARRSRDYAAIRAARPFVTASACAASAAVADVLIYASGVAPPFGGIVAWTAVSVAITWTGTFQWAGESRTKLLHEVVKTDDPAAASELADRCRALLAEDSLTGEERATAALSLTGALIALSARADHGDALAEAATILEEATSASPPAIAFEAASQLVDAMRVKLERTGDDTGYERALDVMMETAERALPVVPEAVGTAFAARANWIAHLAAREPDATRAELIRSVALAAQQRALSATPERSTAHAVRLAALAHLSAAHPYGGDLDAAIRACRAAVKRLRGANDDRALAMLALAELLELRALREPGGGLGGVLDRLWPSRPRHGVVDRLWPDRATHDVARALVLCMRAGMLSGEHAAEARARVLRLRALLAQTNGTRVPRLLDRPMGLAYARLFADQAGISGTRAADVASSWAQWASTWGDDRQAAEAWWCWVTAVAADLRRRVLHDKQRRVSRIQGVTAQAADALARAGRLRDAALTLDLGRAVLLTERMHRDREDLERRLTAAGQADLAARWRAAGDLIERTDREGFEHADRARDAGPGLASTEYVALTEHERLLRAISRVPGFEDVDAPLDYDDVRRAASEGPLVYLAACDRRGFALIVTEASQPTLVELPGLDRASTQRRTALLIQPAGQAGGAQLRTLLHELHRDVVGPLMEAIAPGSLVTLIPVGAIAELPLHAAGVDLDGDGVWHDRTEGTVFRYAPNARVLLRAQLNARRLRAEPARLLSACVPEVLGHRHLPHAKAESEGVAHCFPTELAERPEPATVRSVLRRLDSCTIWHFACHGVHDPASPLDSRLELADGPLTLRTMFAAPAGRRRLAVLSACETARVDGAAPDEVVGFASAMLQAGVAGVVSSHAAVADDAATLLVLGFFVRMRESDSPARALAEAQDWLRTATNADIHARFPTIHEPPTDEDDLGRWRAYRPFADPSSWMLFSYTGA